MKTHLSSIGLNRGRHRDCGGAVVPIFSGSQLVLAATGGQILKNNHDRVGPTLATKRNKSLNTSKHAKVMVSVIISYYRYRYLTAYLDVSYIKNVY